jgi:hypothetical protein
MGDTRRHTRVTGREASDAEDLRERRLISREADKEIERRFREGFGELFGPRPI